MRNAEIRNYAKLQGVLLWEIADELGISDCYFSKKLRHEILADEKQRIMKIIDTLSRKSK